MSELTQLAIGSVWQHYKRGAHYGSQGGPTMGCVRITLLGRDERTGLLMVAYQHIDGDRAGDVWFRWAEEFLGDVTDAQGTQSRFTRVEEGCPNHE